MRFATRSLGAALLLAAFLAGPTAAEERFPKCRVPVFRYALERWHPDYYAVLVYHRGPLGDEAKALVNRLEKAAHVERTAPVNLWTHTIDLDGPPDKDFKFVVEKLGEPKELPWVTVLYPRASGVGAPAYNGKFTKEAVEGLIDSPARQEVIKRILAGETAVWILLESGDKAKDDAAEKLLKTSLKEMESQIELPVDEILGDMYASPDTVVALRLAFSIVRIRRDDPVEQMFITTLLNSEEGLHEFKSPMTFAVFGRGRALEALVEEGINEENIADICFFLTQPCSCRVKSLNPGVDLVLAVDWVGRITGTVIVEKEVPELTGVPEPEPVEVPEKKVEAPLPEPAEEANSSIGISALFIPIVVFLVLVVLVVGFATVVMKSRGDRA